MSNIHSEREPLSLRHSWIKEAEKGRERLRQEPGPRRGGGWRMTAACGEKREKGPGRETGSPTQTHRGPIRTKATCGPEQTLGPGRGAGQMGDSAKGR